MIRCFLAAIAIMLAGVSSASQSSTQISGSSRAQLNLSDFDFVTTKIAANYAGWDTKVTPATEAQLKALTADLRGQAATATDEQLRNLLGRWIGFFRDRHLGINWSAPSESGQPMSQSNVASATSKPVVPTSPWTEERVRAQLAKLGASRDPIEGIWGVAEDTPFGARLGVLRDGGTKTHFSGVVLHSNGPGWNPGEIRATFEKKEGGSYAAILSLGDNRQTNLSGRVIAQGDILQLKDWGLWNRLAPTPSRKELAARLAPSGKMFLQRVSPSTLWLRIPDLSLRQAEPLRSLIESSWGDLTTTPNLIVDLRDNRGGLDRTYLPLIPLFYTQPTISVGAELKATPDNIAITQKWADQVRAESAQAASTADSFVLLMRQHVGGYALIGKRPFTVDRRDRVLPHPAHIAVLIDDAGSSAEQLILLARQSRKVTLFGRHNSRGVLDFSNVLSMTAPSGRFDLSWPISRSLRLPDDPIDPEGISPDVRIPDNVDPIQHIEDWLQAHFK